MPSIENKLKSKPEATRPLLKLVPPVQVHHPMLDAFAKAEYGKLVIHTPEGRTQVFSGKKPGVEGDLKLYSWQVLDALLTHGEVGFAEAYMDGLWDSNDLPAFLTFALANVDTLESYFFGRPLYALWLRFKGFFRRNSISGSKRNIMAHYDLGNDFYKLWLDESMTYSCALFGNNQKLSLEEAQQKKYKRILDKLGAKPGDHILEIGCGWGGFAQAAAHLGIHVTGITISKAQKSYVEKRIHDAGLDGLAKIEMIDYRRIEGKFDHIVSIGMFEHVGENYWPVYFDTIRKHLKHGGKAMIQTITIDSKVFECTRNKHGFINTYIFPGGVLPSKSMFLTAAQNAGLVCNEIFAFGHDYALTLRQWLERFEAKKTQIHQLGYNESFIRMWRLYLSCCIAAFEVGRTDVIQAELMCDS